MSTHVDPFLTTFSVHRLSQRCGRCVVTAEFTKYTATFDTTLTKKSFRRNRPLKVGDNDLHLGAHGRDVMFELVLPRSRRDMTERVKDAEVRDETCVVEDQCGDGGRDGVGPCDAHKLSIGGVDHRRGWRGDPLASAPVAEVLSALSFVKNVPLARSAGPRICR